MNRVILGQVLILVFVAGCKTAPTALRIAPETKMTQVILSGQSVTTEDISVWISCDLILSNKGAFHLQTRIQNHSSKTFLVDINKIKAVPSNGPELKPGTPSYTLLKRKTFGLKDGENTWLHEELHSTMPRIEPQDVITLSNYFEWQDTMWESSKIKDSKQINIHYEILKDQNGITQKWEAVCDILR